MAKKKTELKTEQPDQPADAAVATAETPPPVQANGNGHAPRRPDVSWALNSDRTTRLEVSAWVSLYTNNQGEQYEQVTFTIQRSYRDQNNVWSRGGSWRNHDIPILQFLLNKAHCWALERRTTDSSCPL